MSSKSRKFNLMEGLPTNRILDVCRSSSFCSGVSVLPRSHLAVKESVAVPSSYHKD